MSADKEYNTLNWLYNALYGGRNIRCMRTVSDSYVADCDWYHVYCKNT